MKKLSLHYIAGLIDADGSFSISLSDRRYKGNALTIGATVNLRQLEQFENVLKDVQYTFEKGTIYHHVKNMRSWQTTNIQDTIDVAKTLYPYLQIKKEVCKNFFTILEEWNGKKFNRHTPRSKHQLTRPRQLIEKMMDIAINLNKNQQTKTAYQNKRKRVLKLKRKIARFYSLV